LNKGAYFFMLIVLKSIFVDFVIGFVGVKL
jgi:hypothetical protein